MSNYNTFTEMSAKAGAQSVTGTAETILLAGGTGSTNLVLAIPAWKTVFDGKSFVIRCTGYVTTDTTATATLKMYYSSTAAGAKTTQISTTGASQSLATTSTTFCHEDWLSWDSTSQEIRGQQYGWMGSTVLSATVVTNPVTSIADLSAGVYFMPTITFSAVTTAATVKITDFSIDMN